MNKTIILIFLALFTIFACKEDNTEPEITEPNFFTFDGSTLIHDNSSIVSSDNNIVISGDANHDQNWTLIKTTKQGKELWRKEFPSDDLWHNGCALVEVGNGDIFVCGGTHRNSAVSKTDILLVKTNPDGDTLWMKTYGRENDDFGHSIIETSDDNILISGQTVGNDSLTPGDIYLLKIDYDGDTLWTRSFTAPGSQGTHHLLETKNGEYLITGTNVEDEELSELYLLKVDSNGSKLWDKKIGPPVGRYGRSTIELSNENLVICGYQSGGTEGNSQLVVIKTDNIGNTIWEHEYGEDFRSEIGNSIKENLDGSYTIIGTSYEKTGWYLGDIVLLKIDQTGNQVWFKRFGESGEDNRGRNLIKDTNDDNIITGNFGWAGPIFLTITDKDGNF